MASSKKIAKKAMASPSVAHAFSMPMGHSSKPDRYDIEDAARHLEKHQEIKANKPLHRAALAHLKKKHKAITRALKEK